MARRRRLLAAGFAAVAVAAGLHAVTGPPPPQIHVQVAARDLAAGEVLRAADLEVVSWPAETTPSRLVESPAGRVLAAGVAAGEPLTEPRLVGAGLADAVPGRAVLPLRLPDPGVVALLQPGEKIDLIATDPESGTAHTLASDVVVLAVPQPRDGELGAAATPAGTGALVVLAVSPEAVLAISGAALSDFVSVRI